MTTAVAVLGPVAGPLLGIGRGVATSGHLRRARVGVYVEGVIRRGEDVRDSPSRRAAGCRRGAVATSALGFAGPNPWLDGASDEREFQALPMPIDLDGGSGGRFRDVLTTFPVGVGAAIYLEEYARSQGLMGKFVTLIEINIGNLAGVPSVVYGLLGLSTFHPGSPCPQGSVIVAGLAVGLFILPIVIISAAGGDPVCPRLVPAGVLWNGCHPLADDPTGRPSRSPAGH